MSSAAAGNALRCRPLRPDRLGAGLRLPGLRAAAGGEPLMAQGWLQIAVFVAVLVALVKPVGHLHGAGLHRPAGLPVPRRRANRAHRLQGVARAARRGAGLEGLCPQPDRLLAAVLDRALPDPAHPGHPPVQSRRLPLGAVGPQLQHDLLLHHQHQLAVLRRRNDALLLLPDGRAGGAELRLGRGRDRRRRRPDPRHRRPQRTARSATSGRTWSASCSTSWCRSRSSAPSSSSPRG